MAPNSMGASRGAQRFDPQPGRLGVLGLRFGIACQTQRSRNAAGDTVDDGCHHRLAFDLVGFSVVGEDGLVDAPARFDLDALVIGGQRVEAIALLVGEEAVTGMQGAAGLAERIADPPSVTERGLSDALSASVRTFASQTEEVHHGDSVGKLLGGRGFETAQPVDRDDFDPIPPLLGSSGESLFDRGRRAPLDHDQRPCGPAPVPFWGEVDDHDDARIALAGVSPDADQQRRGPVSERFMREAPHHRVPRRALAPALPTPPVRFNDSALQHRASGDKCCPTDSRPSSTTRQNLVSSGARKAGCGPSRTFRWTVSELPSAGRPRPLSSR